jgi:hypothetical protein
VREPREVPATILQASSCCRAGRSASYLGQSVTMVCHATSSFLLLSQRSERLGDHPPKCVRDNDSPRPEAKSVSRGEDSYKDPPTHASVFFPFPPPSLESHLMTIATPWPGEGGVIQGSVARDTETALNPKDINDALAIS